MQQEQAAGAGAGVGTGAAGGGGSNHENNNEKKQTSEAKIGRLCNSVAQQLCRYPTSLWSGGIVSLCRAPKIDGPLQGRLP